MFKLVKEIVSKDGFLHFRRYRIFETSVASLYLHRIYRADEDIHFHNHPWEWFLGIILLGGYLESYTDVSKYPKHTYKDRLRQPCSVAFVHHLIFHKITKIWGPVTTLVLTGPRVKDSEWGYWSYDEFIPHKDYRERKNEISAKYSQR